MFFENFKLALKSMWTNKMRTFLSLLGIVIGVGSVVAILNLGQSANDSIKEAMEVGGLDMINVMPVTWSREAEFDEEFAQNFAKNVRGIDKVIPTVQSNAQVRYGQELTNTNILGVTSDFFSVNSLELLDGQFFSSLDNIDMRQVVVLGYDLANDLFPAGGAVGNYISIFRTQAKRYLVVGVLDEKDETLGSSYNNGAFIPFNTYSQRFRRVTQVSSYTIKVQDGFDATDVADDIDLYLSSITDSDNYIVYSPAQMVEMADQIMTTMSSFLAAIAAISLVVGGVGIMNIMLVSVVERTREIGIRKALGATPKVIRGQFLVESVTLTITGGLFGIFFGWLLSYIIVRYAGWSLHFSWLAVFLAVAFSTIVGVFFGWYPAMKASKLDPIQALAYE